MKKIILSMLAASVVFATPVDLTKEQTQRINTTNFGTAVELVSSVENSDKTLGVKWKSFSTLISDLKRKQIDKPILLFVAQSTCSYCSQQLRDITADDKLSDYVNQHYYSVYAEQDKEELPRNLFASLVPSFFVLDPATGAPMTAEPASGLIPTKALLGYLQQVKEAYDYYLAQKNKPQVKPNVIK